MFYRSLFTSLLIAVAACVSACSAVVHPGLRVEKTGTQIWELPEADINLEDAASFNHNGFVEDRFKGSVQVLSSADGTDAVSVFFEDSDALIISEDKDSAKLRAASLAVQQHVPMVVYQGDNRRTIGALMSSLKVRRVVLVGHVPISLSTGEVTVMQDPGTREALGELTAFNSTIRIVDSPVQTVAAVASLVASEHVELKPAWESLPVIGKDVRVAALPGQPPRDGRMAPVIIATPETPIALVANARAYGADIRVMPTDDPRDSKAAFAMVAGLADGPLIALGEQFGSPGLLSDRIRQGWRP